MMPTAALSLHDVMVLTLRYIETPWFFEVGRQAYIGNWARARLRNVERDVQPP